MKVTKAPRKTLAAILRLMNARWGTITVIYDSFGSWPILDRQTKMDILSSMTELRWIIADTGVMVVAALKGEALELEEQFAGAEQVDWSMPGADPSVWRRDDPRPCARPVLARRGVDRRTLTDARRRPRARGSRRCGGRRHRAPFSAMAEVAFGDAATRGVDAVMDDAAIAAALPRRRVTGPLADAPEEAPRAGTAVPRRIPTAVRIGLTGLVLGLLSSWRSARS